METALDQGAHLHGLGEGLMRNSKKKKKVVQRTCCYLICKREFIFNPLHPIAVQTDAFFLC